MFCFEERFLCWSQTSVAAQSELCRARYYQKFHNAGESDHHQSVFWNGNYDLYGCYHVRSRVIDDSLDMPRDDVSVYAVCGISNIWILFLNK